MQVGSMQRNIHTPRWLSPFALKCSYGDIPRAGGYPLLTRIRIYGDTMCLGKYTLPTASPRRGDIARAAGFPLLLSYAHMGITCSPGNIPFSPLLRAGGIPPAPPAIPFRSQMLIWGCLACRGYTLPPGIRRCVIHEVSDFRLDMTPKD